MFLDLSRKLDFGYFLFISTEYAHQYTHSICFGSVASVNVSWFMYNMIEKFGSSQNQFYTHFK